MTTPVSQEGTCARFSLLVSVHSYVIPELPILEAVIGYAPSQPLGTCPLPFSPISIYSIRNRLTALKKDRGDFIKSSDVNSLYQAVIKQGLLSHPIHRISIFNHPRQSQG